MKHTLNFLLSPIIMQLEMPSQVALILSSIGTGAMFSPPAPMISSLKRPVIRTIPRASFTPSSPECSQPSSSIDSSFFALICATCSAPRSGLAAYPIMMWRPRKQISPFSASPGCFMLSVSGHSCLAPSPPCLKIFTSVPGICQPQEPHTCARSVDHVVAPVHSDIPYTSFTNMPSEPKYSSVATWMGAAPVKPNLHSVRPMAALIFCATLSATP